MNKKENPIQNAEASSQEVLNRLANFHVIQNPGLRRIFSWLPILLLLLILVDWLIGSGSFSLDTFRSTGVLTIAAILAATQYLFKNLPQTFETLWKRDLLSAQAGRSDFDSFITYLNRFQNLLLGRYAWILGLVCAFGGLLATYPVQYYLKAGKFPLDFMRWFTIG